MTILSHMQQKILANLARTPLAKCQAAETLCFFHVAVPLARGVGKSLGQAPKKLNENNAYHLGQLGTPLRGVIPACQAEAGIPPGPLHVRSHSVSLGSRDGALLSLACRPSTHEEAAPCS